MFFSLFVYRSPGQLIGSGSPLGLKLQKFLVTYISLLPEEIKSMCSKEFFKKCINFKNLFLIYWLWAPSYGCYIQYYPKSFLFPGYTDCQNYTSVHCNWAHTFAFVCNLLPVLTWVDGSNFRMCAAVADFFNCFYSI